MKKFWERNKHVIVLLIVWRIVLFFIEKAAPSFISLHDGYNGPIPWANHDGIHYLTIARSGYFQYSEAFFPLYPIIIYFLSTVQFIAPWISASVFSYGCFFLGIVLLHETLQRDHTSDAWWTMLFLIAFPVSFFYTAVYTEGLFFLLSILVYVSVRQKKWFLVGLFGFLASATRLFGVLLFLFAIIEYFSMGKKFWKLADLLYLFFIPFGLLFYMIYLYVRSGDPLLFFHIQPAFGANRSGSEIILVPQVLWRYMKIIFTAFLKPTPASYFISVLELVATFFSYTVLVIGWIKKERWSLLIYGFLVVTLPTLTGTFSSMPRYLLSVFPLFFILGKLDNKTIKYGLLYIFIALQIVLSAMFLRGWFVA
jgi:hypothetical protein